MLLSPEDFVDNSYIAKRRDLAKSFNNFLTLGNYTGHQGKLHLHRMTSYRLWRRIHLVSIQYSTVPTLFHKMRAPYSVDLEKCRFHNYSSKVHLCI